MVGTANDSLRKGWNEAMMSVGAGIAGGPSSSRRSSDRHKKQARRDKARKSTAFSGEGSSLEHQEYRSATRVDALEGVSTGGAEDDDDEFYDEAEEATGASFSRKKRGSKKRGGKNAQILLSKRLKVRSLASILVEDSTRFHHLGVTQKYLQAEARMERQVPPRKFCPVTGLFGVYTDPKSGIPYANRKALEQIREREPPWLNCNTGGTAAYYEAVKSLREAD